MEPTKSVITGEVVAGQAKKIRKEAEQLIKSLETNQFDIGEKLATIKQNGWYTEWGFTTFLEYVKSTGLKDSKARYLPEIAEKMKLAGVTRAEYEKVGIAKLRAIASLDPNEVWINPDTKEELSLLTFINGLTLKCLADETYKLETLKKDIRTLKGFVGEKDLVFRTLAFMRTVIENVWDPAIALAKNHLGTGPKDAEGLSPEASDSAAAEVLAISFLNDPSNAVGEHEDGVEEASLVPGTYVLKDGLLDLHNPESNWTVLENGDEQWIESDIGFGDNVFDGVPESYPDGETE